MNWTQRAAEKIYELVMNCDWEIDRWPEKADIAAIIEAEYSAGAAKVAAVCDEARELRTIEQRLIQIEKTLREKN